MRHRKKEVKKIGTSTPHSKAMARNLITSLVEKGKIQTTKRRAKAIQPQVEKMISFVLKHEPLEAVRRVNSIVYTEQASRIVINDLKNRYQDRTSGFTRVKRAGLRTGDNADLVTIEFV